jgi:hypothetical protein
MKNRISLLILFLFTIFYSPRLLGEVIYVSPNGTGDGTNEDSPMGSLSGAVNLLEPGDTLILLDGEYLETLDLSDVRGTESKRITIKAKNICGAFINGDVKRQHAVRLRYSDYLTIDGIKAGNTLHAVWKIEYSDDLILTRCAGFNAGYLVAQDGHAQLTYADNCHIFDIAYSDGILAEDIWAWGTGRYNFVYFKCTNCIVRRGVFRPTNQELGYGYDRGPHSGFNLYDCDNSIAENCIAFETRFHPESDQAPDNPWGLVMGGMVFDDHTDPSGYNYVLGCFDLDNGNTKEELPRTNPAVHLMSKWSGQLEDVVIWKNALNYGIIVNTSGKVDLPKRALIGSPSRIRQNNAKAENLNYRYVNGELTGIALWPWPYEDIIKEQMEMQETITEYVSRMVSPHLNLRTTQVDVDGVNLNQDTINISHGEAAQLIVTISPSDASNRTVTWSSADTTIAKVDEKGLVTAVDGSMGTTTITATTIDGSFTAECIVIVELKTSAGNFKNTFELEIYPNPVKGNGFKIIVPGKKNYSYDIINLHGQAIYRKTGISGQSNVNTRDFKSGLYFVRVASESKTSIQKIIIR